MAHHRMIKIQTQNMPRKWLDSKFHLSPDVIERLSFDVIKLHPMRTRNEVLVDDVYRKCQLPPIWLTERSNFKLSILLTLSG